MGGDEGGLYTLSRVSFSRLVCMDSLDTVPVVKPSRSPNSCSTCPSASQPHARLVCLSGHDGASPAFVLLAFECILRGGTVQPTRWPGEGGDLGLSRWRCGTVTGRRLLSLHLVRHSG